MKKRGTGEGSVFEERPGRWVGLLSLGYEATPDGTRLRIRKKFTGPTQAAVLRKLTTARKQLLGGGIVPRDVESLGDFMPRWLTGMKPHVRPKTWHEYNRHWELYIRPALANLKLNKLLPSHVESMTRGLLARGLSPRTAGHAQATLRAALKEAERHGLVARNVASLARMPRAPRKEVAPLSPQDAARLLQAAEGSRCEAALAIMLYLGLRIGETLGLKWEDINFEQRTLSVRRALIRTGGEWKMVDGKRKQVGTRLLFQEPKTARSRRILPIPAPLVETLLRQHAAQAGQVLRGDFSQDSGLVVTNTRGGPLEPRLVGKELDRLLASLGLPHLNVHGLRHTAASMLIACGYGLGQVQQILGHSNVSLTADLYGHLLTDAARDPLDRMASLLRPGDGPKKPVATSVATSGKIARPN